MRFFYDWIPNSLEIRRNFDAMRCVCRVFRGDVLVFYPELVARINLFTSNNYFCVRRDERFALHSHAQCATEFIKPT